jgi:hypothetical protein
MGMDIAFQTRALRDLCEDDLRLIARFGKDAATQIVARMADLRATESIQELVAAGLCLTLQDGRLASSIAAGWRIILAPNHLQRRHASLPPLPWSQVTRVKVMAIESAT